MSSEKIEKNSFGCFDIIYTIISICLFLLLCLMVYAEYTYPKFRCIEYQEYVVQINDVQNQPPKITYENRKVCKNYINDKSRLDSLREK